MLLLAAHQSHANFFKTRLKLWEFDSLSRMRHSTGELTYLLTSKLKYFIKKKFLAQLFSTFLLTRNAFPRTTSSTLAPEGGAASLLEAKPIDEEVDILDKSEDSEETLGHEDCEADDDKGKADETEDILEVEVKLSFDSSAAAALPGLLDSSVLCWGSRRLAEEDIKVLITKSLSVV